MIAARGGSARTGDPVECDELRRLELHVPEAARHQVQAPCQRRRQAAPWRLAQHCEAQSWQAPECPPQLGQERPAPLLRGFMALHPVAQCKPAQGPTLSGHIHICKAKQFLPLKTTTALQSCTAAGELGGPWWSCS